MPNVGCDILSFSLSVSKHEGKNMTWPKVKSNILERITIICSFRALPTPPACQILSRHFHMV